MTGFVARVVIVACVLLVGVSGTLAADADNTTEPFGDTISEADTTVLDVLLNENGTATWRVAAHIETNTDEGAATFERVRADIQANTSAYRETFREWAERAAANGENATGREMQVRRFNVSTTTQRLENNGTVAFRFQWTNFSTADSEEIRAGPALANLRLGNDSRLLVSWPEGYRASSFAVEPDDQTDRTATYEGPVEFGPEGPAVTAVPRTGLPLVAFAGAAVVGIVLAGGVWYVMNREELG